MKIITDRITIEELKEMGKRMFDNLVKGVVDIEKGIMAVDAELHADELTLLIENGSKPENLWGINMYPDNPSGDFVEFDSVINIRPAQKNRNRGVESQETRKIILDIVNKLIIK